MSSTPAPSTQLPAAVSLIVLAMASVLLASWQSSLSTSAAPPIPKLGIDFCEACSMTLSNAKTVGAFLVADKGQSKHLFFDDLGCMFDAERDKHSFTIRERWVADFAAPHLHPHPRWLRAEQAFYILDLAIRTPMSSGLVAFSSKNQAQQNQPGRTVLTFPQAVAGRKHSMESRFGKPAN